MIEQALNTDRLNRLETLRQRINDETYLHAAIQRLALVLSNEIMGIEGRQNERKRKRRE